MFEKVVLVTRKTRLQELIARFNTVGQAKFYIEHAGGDFQDYQEEDENYRQSLNKVVRQLRVFDETLRLQILDRELLPTYLFSGRDLIITLGQDGLVANTAKYVGTQPIVGMNPDPARFDGVLLPFLPDETEHTVKLVLSDRAVFRSVTLALALLHDGQRLLAFNDLFIGARTHVSARYKIKFGEQEVAHSSSGIIVSTGAGSTGWLSSVFNMATGVARLGGGTPPRPVTFDWSDGRLYFVVREPFASRHSSTDLIAGVIEPARELWVESLMPSGGVIFSDGMEQDFLRFDSGVRTCIRIAENQARLVIR